MEEDLLYSLLRQILVEEQRDLCPPDAADILLGMLDEIHEPQVWLLTCVLIGQMCSLTSMARSHLAHRGALSSLAGVLSRSISSVAYLAPSSEKAKLYEQLVTFVMSMLQHFSLGSSVCINKILQSETLNSILLAVNCSTSALYVYGNADTKMRLKSLVAGRSLVGRQLWLPSTSTSSVYCRLLGCDVEDVVGADVAAIDSCVVDLYDTDGDDDVHIIDQVMLSSGASSVWKSLSEDLDGLTDYNSGEWVDVYVTCVLDGAHFVAVFGADNIEQFHQLRQSVTEAVTNQSTPLMHLPSRGQLICVSHPEFGNYRAYIVNVDSSDKIVTFSPDCGYVEEVPLSYLKTCDDSSVTLPSPSFVRVCRLMGEFHHLRCIVISPHLLYRLILFYSSGIYFLAVMLLIIPCPVSVFVLLSLFCVNKLMNEYQTFFCT